MNEKKEIKGERLLTKNSRTEFIPKDEMILEVQQLLRLETPKSGDFGIRWPIPYPAQVTKVWYQ
jgi:hypothetical protein